MKSLGYVLYLMTFVMCTPTGASATTIAATTTGFVRFDGTSERVGNKPKSAHHHQKNA